ncbi:MAG: hypothetical protein JXR41_12115 [Bacteroidales bacterium]|nr:hypothetical protein [Bacteroidales bacterium]MBN2763830.1 hypothetical protein [Bacteroidales bacterium]
MKILSAYNRKQVLFVFLVFILFTLIVLYSGSHLEKRNHIIALNRELNGYTELIHNFIVMHDSYRPCLPIGRTTWLKDNSMQRINYSI